MNELKIVGTAKALNDGREYKTTLKSQQHTLIADEPVAVGGTDEGPSPGDYLCMSLAACKVITLRMYVQRKQWDAGEIDVRINLIRSDGDGGTAHSFVCELSVTGTLTQEQKDRLLQIAKLCPISKLLAKGSSVSTVFV